MNAIDTNSPGKRVRDKRIALELTQPDLAKASGVSQSVISDFETGKKPDIMASALMGLCEALDLSADWVWRGERADWPFPNVTPAQYRSISEETRRNAEVILSQAVKRLTIASAQPLDSGPTPGETDSFVKKARARKSHGRHKNHRA